MRSFERRCVAALVLATGLLSIPARGQLAADLGPRGEVRQLKVGEVVYFEDLGLSVIRPGWSGRIADQRELAADSVKVEVSGPTRVYTARMAGEAVGFRLRETVRDEKDAIHLDYEITPEQDVDVETIALQGIMPTGPHAGRTRYLVAGDEVTRGPCPDVLNEQAYVLFHRPGADWLGFVHGDGGALRLTPTHLEVQFQDDRKWDRPAFGLLAMAGGGKLRKDRPIRFAIRFAAERAEALEAEARARASRELASMELGDHRPLAVGRISVDRPTTQAHETIELSTEVAATYDNPFDCEQIAVDAEVIAPGGNVISVPGFFDLPMRLDRRRGSERIVADGPAVFRVRYTPTVEGPHRLTLKARDRSGTVAAAPVEISAGKSSVHGFVRVAKGSPRYFAFDGGPPYFAIGENLCWSSGRTPLADYTAWMKGLGSAGGNWARLWLAFNEKGLEWMPAPTPKPGAGSYRGLGRYALDNARRLDEVMRLAREHGVYLMFCLGTYGEFTEGGYFNEGSWISNPYNARNGGPCARPQDFWTDPTARKLYQQRLRYLIARWGAYPNLFAWEFWNEVPPTPSVNAWVAEMAAYLKQHDPNRHLVSTSYGDAATWAIADVDFTMTHRYGQAGNTANFAGPIAHEARGLRSAMKPYLLAEFGIDWQTSDDRWDRSRGGRNMHDGAWAAMMSGAAGTAMLWYWDSYVHPANLYRVLSPVSAFARTVDWAATPLEPIDGLRVERSADGPETFRELNVSATQPWGRTPSSEHSVGRDGTVDGGPVTMTLGSPSRGNRGELFSTLTWRLDMPQASKAVVRLGEVCSGARLRIILDGRTVLDRKLEAGAPGKGPWKHARLLEPWKVWVSDYDEDVAVDVPAGRHVLGVSNVDGDWLQVRSLTLPHYRSSRYPEVEALGLASDRLLLLWVHNLESNWRTEHDGKQPGLLTAIQVKVPQVGEGTWQVEWWDTDRGEVLQRVSVPSRAGTLTLPVPEFRTDLAARISREP